MYHVWVGGRHVMTAEIGSGMFRTKRALEIWVTRKFGTSREPVEILTNTQHRSRLAWAEHDNAKPTN